MCEGTSANHALETHIDTLSPPMLRGSDTMLYFAIGKRF
jgi:hypothetical protein